MSTAPHVDGPGGVVSLSQYLRVARRRAGSIVFGVAIGLSLGMAHLQVAPTVYEARSTVTISPITPELFSGTPVNQLVNPATEAAIVRSIEVAARAGETLGGSTDPRDLLEDLAVQVPLSSQALDITFESSSAEGAAAGANAFAESYLEFRAATAEARRGAFIERLEEQLATLNEDLEASEPDSAEREVIAGEITAVRQQLGSAASLTLTPGELVSPALAPRQRASPRALLSLPAGLVLGALLGVLLAAYRQRTDDRLLDDDDVERASGWPVIGHLPATFEDLGELPSSEIDQLAVTARHLQHPRFAGTQGSWLLVRADLGTQTRADALARWLGRRRPVELLRPHVPLGEEWVTRVLGGPATSTDARDRAPLRIIDGGSARSLADVLDLTPIAGVTVVVVELGRTRAAELRRFNDVLRDDAPDRSLVPGVLVIDRSTWRRRTRGWPSRPHRMSSPRVLPASEPDRRPTVVEEDDEHGSEQEPAARGHTP